MRTSDKAESGIACIWLLVAIGAAVLLVALFAVTAVATDQPTFCKTCHSMEPYYDAWHAGPHKDQWCIDCHVNPGMPARFAHKPIALKELYAQVRGDTLFPRPRTTEVPDSRCLRCHPKPGPKDPPKGFSHAEHQTYSRCQLCHADVGHRVTDAALKSVGAFNAQIAAQRRAERSTIPSGSIALPAAGVANLNGHKPVVCSRCHDMARSHCPTCHTHPARNHPKNNDCNVCHDPGPRFVFMHPPNPDCAPCHALPKTEHPNNTDCTLCHRFKSKWAFIHPDSKDCPTCHELPTKSGHPSDNDDCSLCHRVKSEWAFVHPKRTDCPACHKPPSGHESKYGSNCRSCHSTSVPFAKATFDHPGNTGEHSYRSFACSKCHPSGPPQASCTCHGGGRPSGD
ncbi:MAG: NapC/NirT family cytochrome c [Coriobacteriales bacterium]|nr:NapC/NirT family cytochrome c [Coriobacteriales bacterium]